MINSTLKKEILEKLDLLAVEEQRRVFDFTCALTRNKPVGTPGRDLLRFAGTIEKTDLKSMRCAITDKCERVDCGDKHVIISSN